MERIYVIPLRKEWMKVPRYKRAKKAITAIRSFIMKHMKVDDVKIGYYLNLEIWKKGIKNPPSRVKVNVAKEKDKNVANVELFGVKIKEKEEKKKKKVKGEKKGEGNGKGKEIKKEENAEKKDEKREGNTKGKEIKEEKKPEDIKNPDKNIKDIKNVLGGEDEQ